MERCPENNPNEITPEMIEAGAQVAWQTDLSEPREAEIDEMVARIFSVMLETQKKYRREVL